MTFEDSVQIAGCSINLFFDLAIAVVPVPVFWNLQMEKKKKIKVVGIFAAGAM